MNIYIYRAIGIMYKKFGGSNYGFPQLPLVTRIAPSGPIQPRQGRKAGILAVDQVAGVVNHAMGLCDQVEGVHEVEPLRVIEVIADQGADRILVNPDRFAVCRDFHLLPLRPA